MSTSEHDRQSLLSSEPLLGEDYLERMQRFGLIVENADGNWDLSELVFVVPIKTVNEANGSHGHWAAKASRRKKQREATRLAFLAAVRGKRWEIPPPYQVRLCRVSAGLLDTDALPLSLKSVRDQIADELGVTDAPTDERVAWHYEQFRGKRGRYEVTVRIGC